MRKFLIGLFAALVIFAGFSSSPAFAATTVTPSASVLTVGDTLTLTTDGPVVITAGSFFNTLSSPDCTFRQYGSYTNGGQKNEYTCSQATTLSGVTNNAGTQTFTTDAGQYISVTINAKVVVTPPPAPAPKYTVVKTLTGSSYYAPYTVTITNVGNADGVYAYGDNTYTPSSLDKIQAPAGSIVAYGRVCSRLRVCRTVGFQVTNIVLPVGATATINVSA